MFLKHEENKPFRVQTILNVYVRLRMLLHYMFFSKTKAFRKKDKGRCGMSAKETTLHPNNNL